jgi:hypothetical protein
MTDTGSGVAEEGAPLELSIEQELALRGLGALARVLSLSLGSVSTRHVAVGLGRASLLAASAPVGDALPKCPFAPPNHGIGTKYDAVFNMHLECDHGQPDGGPHCWSFPAKTRVPCP